MWEKSFRNLNINETITCDGKDPPWFNNNIKQLIQEKKNTYKSHILSDKKAKSLQNQLKCSIEGNKEKYYLRISKTLIDPTTNAKTYWSIFKTLLNNKKFPCIPPLFH